MDDEETSPATAQQLLDRVSRIRAALLGDGATEQEIADALECSRRKVQRLGLPYEKVAAIA